MRELSMLQIEIGKLYNYYALADAQLEEIKNKFPTAHKEMLFNQHKKMVYMLADRIYQHWMINGWPEFGALGNGLKDD